MKKKNILNAVLWGALMIVIQVVVDVVRDTAINWIEVLIGGGIVFLICIGSKKNPTIERKKPEKTNKVPNIVNQDITLDVDEVKNNSVGNNVDANMNDLRFYAYNRIAIFSLVIGAGCIIYGCMGHPGNVFWLYLVGIICLVQTIIFFIFYAKKRDEFVKKESINREEKNKTKSV